MAIGGGHDDRADLPFRRRPRGIITAGSPVATSPLPTLGRVIASTSRSFTGLSCAAGPTATPAPSLLPAAGVQPARTGPLSGPSGPRTPPASGQGLRRTRPLTSGKKMAGRK
jgi:hypothetical protein